MGMAYLTKEPGAKLLLVEVLFPVLQTALTDGDVGAGSDGDVLVGVDDVGAGLDPVHEDEVALGGPGDAPQGAGRDGVGRSEEGEDGSEGNHRGTVTWLRILKKSKKATLEGRFSPG